MPEGANSPRLNQLLSSNGAHLQPFSRSDALDIPKFSKPQIASAMKSVLNDRFGDRYGPVFLPEPQVQELIVEVLGAPLDSGVELRK